MSVDAGAVASTLALLYLAYLITRSALSRGRRIEEGLAEAIGALALLGIITSIDAAELAVRAGGNPLWTDYRYTGDVGRRLEAVANGTLSAWSGILQAAAYVDAVLIGAGIALLIVGAGTFVLAVYAIINAGAAALKGVAVAVVMVAQTVWAAGRLYQLVAWLAPFFRPLVTLGAALMVAPGVRRVGAALFALGVLMGYAIPYALNAATPLVVGAVPTPPVLVPVNASAVTINLFTRAPLNGTWVLAPVPPPAAVNLTMVEPPPGVPVAAPPISFYAVRPAGYPVVLPPGTYSTAWVSVGGAVLPTLPASVRIPFAASNMSCPPDALVREGSALVRVDYAKCSYTARAVNVTLAPERGEHLTVVGAGRGWAFIAGTNYTIVGGWASWSEVQRLGYSSPWIVAERAVTSLDPGAVELNASVEVCARVYGMIELERVEPGEALLRGGAVVEVEPEVRMGGCTKCRWAGGLRALAFNTTVSLLPNAELETARGAFCVDGAEFCTKVVNGTLAKAVKIGGTTVESPLSWTQPELITYTVCATYPAGSTLLRPARVWWRLVPEVLPEDSVLANLLSQADTALEAAARAGAGELRAFFSYHALVTVAAAYFAAAVACCDLLSGMLGGPSISVRFALRRLRGYYWSTAIRAVAGAIASIATMGIPIPAGGVAYGTTAASGRLTQLLERVREVKQRYSLAERTKRALALRLEGRVELLRGKLGRVASRVERLLLEAGAPTQPEVVREAAKLVERLARNPGLRTFLASTAELARSLWKHASEHSVDAALAALRDALAAAAYRAAREAGTRAHPALIPGSPRRLWVASRVAEAARLAINPRSLFYYALVQVAARYEPAARARVEERAPVVIRFERPQPFKQARRGRPKSGAPAARVGVGRSPRAPRALTASGREAPLDGIDAWRDTFAALGASPELSDYLARTYSEVRRRALELGDNFASALAYRWALARVLGDVRRLKPDHVPLTLRMISDPPARFEAEQDLLQGALDAACGRLPRSEAPLYRLGYGCVAPEVLSEHLKPVVEKLLRERGLEISNTQLTRAVARGVEIAVSAPPVEEVKLPAPSNPEEALAIVAAACLLGEEEALEGALDAVAVFAAAEQAVEWGLPREAAEEYTLVRPTLRAGASARAEEALNLARALREALLRHPDRLERAMKEAQQLLAEIEGEIAAERGERLAELEGARDLLLGALDAARRTPPMSFERSSSYALGYTIVAGGSAADALIKSCREGRADFPLFEGAETGSALGGVEDAMERLWEGAGRGALAVQLEEARGRVGGAVEQLRASVGEEALKILWAGGSLALQLASEEERARAAAACREALPELDSAAAALRYVLRRARERGFDDVAREAERLLDYVDKLRSAILDALESVDG